MKAGDVVAQIDPVLFQATVTQAEGDLANAQAALELAKVNATRTQELFAKKILRRPTSIKRRRICIRPKRM